MQSAKNGRGKRHIPFSQRLHETLDFPLEGFKGITRVEVIGRHEAIAEGCECVLIYTAESIVLRMRKGYVRITGEELEMESLIGDRITVRGIIHAVHLCETDKTEAAP